MKALGCGLLALVLLILLMLGAIGLPFFARSVRVAEPTMVQFHPGDNEIVRETEAPTTIQLMGPGDNELGGEIVFHGNMHQHRSKSAVRFMSPVILILVVLGLVVVGVIGLTRGGRSNPRSAAPVEEARVMQEIYRDLERLCDRVENLETLLLEREKARRA
jgi:hypothetical protein